MNRSRSLLVGLAVMVGSAAVGGGEVSATSCAMLAGYTWQTIADGTALFDVEGAQIPPEPFFDVFDSVVIGQVTAIEGYVAGVYPDDGVGVTLTVVGALRTSTVDPTVVIRQPDLGEMYGYPFVLGQTYMVPLRAGAPDRVNLCEPIIGLSLSNAEEALALATEAGITVAFPTEAAVSVVEATDDGAVTTDVEEAGSESVAVRTLARWVGVALVAAVVGWFVRRRRRSEQN